MLSRRPGDAWIQTGLDRIVARAAKLTPEQRSEIAGRRRRHAGRREETSV